jgi:hypothetical protein
MKTWHFLGSTLLLLALGAVAAATWQGLVGEPGNPAHADPGVIVGIDMNTTGNTCPNDGTDCTLGAIDDCVATTAGATIGFDVFLDGLSADSYLGAGYRIDVWPPSSTLQSPGGSLPHNDPTVNLTAQQGAVLDLSDALPDSIPPWNATIADFTAAEYNPPYTQGVLGRYDLDLTGVAAGVYYLTLSNLVIGRDNPPRRLADGGRGLGRQLQPALRRHRRGRRLPRLCGRVLREPDGAGRRLHHPDHDHTRRD